MRVISGNINFSDSAPLTVEEMKDGEVWATTDGLYARVGNQVLFQSMGEGQWVQHFFNDATGWEGYVDVSWDGDSWNSNGESPEIRVHTSATWEEGYRPTKVRMLIKTPSGGGTLTTTIRDGSNNVLATLAAPRDDAEHIVEVDVTFYDEDIYRILAANPTGYQIRNIEFFEDLFPPIATTTTTTTTTSAPEPPTSTTTTTTTTT
jgi:hypothetical protein